MPPTGLATGCTWAPAPSRAISAGRSLECSFACRKSLDCVPPGPLRSPSPAHWPWPPLEPECCAGRKTRRPHTQRCLRVCRRCRGGLGESLVGADPSPVSASWLCRRGLVFCVGTRRALAWVAPGTGPGTLLSPAACPCACAGPAPRGQPTAARVPIFVPKWSSGTSGTFCRRVTVTGGVFTSCSRALQWDK